MDIPCQNIANLKRTYEQTYAQVSYIILLRSRPWRLVWKAFVRSWVRGFGVLEIVVVDQGRECMGNFSANEGGAEIFFGRKKWLYITCLEFRQGASSARSARFNEPTESRSMSKSITVRKDSSPGTQTQRTLVLALYEQMQARDFSQNRFVLPLF